MSDTASGDWEAADAALAAFKLAVLRELVRELEERGSDKVVRMRMEGDDPEFFTVDFALHGDQLARLDPVWGAYLQARGREGSA